MDEDEKIRYLDDTNLRNTYRTPHITRRPNVDDGDLRKYDTDGLILCERNRHHSDRTTHSKFYKELILAVLFVISALVFWELLGLAQTHEMAEIQQSSKDGHPVEFSALPGRWFVLFLLSLLGVFICGIATVLKKYTNK